MNYTQAQIDRANAVSLEDFLRTQGETLIKSGREYRWKEHDSLTVRGNKWFRHSQSKGGYPIDFVMEFYGKSFPEAVQLLTGESGEGQTEATTAPPTAFHLPLHNRTADRAIQYLCESRGLNPKLVEAFLLSGDIYEDAKRHNVVFVGRDRSGTPRYAHVRGTADPFRQDITGSDKSYPFRYEGNGNQLFVFEAPIDLLSFICLYPQDWQTRSYLALGGVSGKALDRFLSERKDTRKVFLCLDSDTAGSEACTRLAQSIPGEIAVIRLVPARKDWNDVLRQQGDIPSRKFIAETITLRELPTAQPVPMLRMADVELTSVDWLWFPYIPFGKLTIIQGNPGEGKTYFAMRLAAACTNRKPLPGMETLEPFNIIYQTAEDGLGDTVKPRLMEADADLERVLVIDDEEMYPDGICRITNRLYSKSVLCDDINYAEASDDEKAVLFELYCKLVNYFGPSVGFELSVICYPADLVEYRKMLALNPQGDQFDEIRKEYSDMLVRQVSKSRYERRICLTYTIEADGIRQARSRLEQIDNDVVGHFRALTVAAHPMDGYERLTILHRCLHLEENRKFRFNWDSLNHTGLSSKDYIAPSSFFFKDGRYFRSGASFGAVSFLQIRATKLYDTLLNSILNMEGSQIVSIHAKALDQNAALKAVKRKLSDLDKAKIDEQKRAVRSGFDMDILPPDLVTFGKEAQKLLEDLQNHDEKMFMVTILVVHAASSRQKLENLIYSANGITNTQNCDLIRLDYQQEQGFVSALPIGINQVEIQRGLTTSGTAIFLPFRACEVFQPKGVYYGLNATTNRMILADRKTLKCPNGVVLGTPGSGKSFSCKREAADVYLHTTDDLLFLDPENEYTSLCQQLSGQVIRLAPDSHDYINPLDVDLTTNTGENPLLMKADFIMSFCELILSAAQGGLKPIEKSVIDRCIPKIYRQLIKDPRPENMPILGDLYECLRAQQEEQAQELATALELYVFGSLNYLNHRTNVNVDNRVACYDISGLGQNLKKPGMLTVQNNIWQRTIVNRYAGKTTRIYLDEFHLLLKEPQTAAYTAEIYKRFRKWNGIPTSLTQNVKDLLESPEIENILENSDFILMLNQAASDRNILAQRLGISPQELGHITNSDAGEGLLFFGDKIIPFVDKFPTDTKLYQVMTTKPADLAA